MVGGYFEQDIAAIALLGIMANFLFSFMFGLYLSQNIGMEQMMQSKGDKKQNFLVSLSILIHYAKVLLTLYRVTILQLYFLNKGYTHLDYWLYLTSEDVHDKN